MNPNNNLLRGGPVVGPEPHKLRQAGSIPAPATNLMAVHQREMVGMSEESAHDATTGKLPSGGDREPDSVLTHANGDEVLAEMPGDSRRRSQVGLTGQGHHGVAPGVEAGAHTKGRGGRNGFLCFLFRPRNRRGHRLAWCLARQHPEWELYRTGPDALDLALLLALLAFLEILAIGML